MVVKGVSKYLVQQLAQRVGPRIKTRVTQEYGQIAGAIVGGAIGLAGGDWYGGLTGNTGLPGKPGNDSPYDRNAPVGYYERGGLSGPSNGTQLKALRPTFHINNRSRRSFNKETCCCCSGRRQKYSRRSRRR